MRSRQRTRRLAIGSALSLLTLTVVGGAFFTSSSTAAAAFNAVADWERTRGKTSQGIEDARRAVELYRRVQQIQPGVMTVQRSLADAYAILASMQSQAGDAAGAAETYAEGLAVIEALLAGDPGNTDTLSILCVLLNNSINVSLALRRIGEARALSDRQCVAAAELLERSPDRGNAGRAVALAAVRRIAVLRAAGEVEEGLEAGREAVSIADAMAVRFPQEPELRQNRIVARGWYAGLLGEANRREESLEVSREICLAADEAAAADPRLLVSWESVGGTYSNYSEALRNAGRMREAQDASARSVAAFRTLLELDPMRVVSMASLANALLGQGSVLEVSGDIEAAAAAHAEAVKIGLSLEQLDPTNNDARDTVVRASATMARLLADHGREAEAADFIATALDAHRRQLERVPEPKEAERFARDNSLYRVVMAANALNDLDLMMDLLEQIRASRAMDKTPSINDRVLASQVEPSTGRSLAQAGRIRAALEATTSSTLILQQLTRENPASAFLQSELAIALQVDASYAHHLGDFQLVLVSSTKGIDALNAMQPAVASSAQNTITRANILRTRAAALVELGRADEALADLDESLSQLAPSVDAGVAGAIRGRVEGLIAKAQVLARSGRTAEARTALDEAAAIRPWRNEPEARRRLLDRTLLAGELELADASGDAARIRECLENLLAAFQPRPGREDNMNSKAARAVVLLRLGRAEEAAPLVAEVRATDFRGGRFFEPLAVSKP